MVTDQEPRYRLVDADGNVVGSLFAEADGTLKLQEGTSGDDNELAFGTQGALEVEQVDVASVDINQSYTDPTGFTQNRKLVGAKPIPTPTAYLSGPAHGEGGDAFIGATLAPDGRVVFAPFDSDNVGIFDPSNDSYISGPAHGEGSRHPTPTTSGFLTRATTHISQAPRMVKAGTRSPVRRSRRTAASSSRHSTPATSGL